jgi:two-component system, NtrC family, nitrogen regulation response regulator GlnG
MSTLLVIDDEEPILHFFRRAFHEPEISLVTATSAAEGVERVSRDWPDVIILDIDLPDQSGLEAFRQIQQLAPKIPVIFITGHGTTATAIEAMSLGAYEYLLKPLELHPLSELVARALEISRLMRVPVVMEEEGQAEDAPDLIVGRCAAMQEVYKAIGRVAPQDVMVLILGETGTGKEVVARAIYQYSRRAAEPFMAINCAAIPESLLESELFGHERGAFTGADRRRIGRFEQGQGGTLFLDEIGDMAPLTQTKILRVLQDQRFERVGGGETIKTNVRVIAATNRDLERLIAASQFRSDLYYRLKVYTIRLPPLRERGEDLPLLVMHFLRRFSRELKKDVYGVAPEAMEVLRRYPWPGNVRELQSVVKQALVQSTGPVLVPEFLPPALFAAKANDTATPTSTSPLDLPDLEQFVNDRLMGGSTELYTEWQSITEKFLLTHALRHTGGNLSHAAHILGIHRSTLRAKIAALGIAVDRLTSSTNERSAGSNGGAKRPTASAGDQPVASAGEEQ